LKKERRRWSAEEKTKLLRRRLIEKVPVSKICEEAPVAPEHVPSLAGRPEDSVE
jgi:transposase-like protein